MHRHWHRWDLIGGGLTLLCAIHCLMTPILLTSLPFFASEGFEEMVAIVLIGAASLAVVGGAWQHRQFGALLPYAVGLAIFSTRTLAGPHGSTAEISVTLVASVFFLTAHAMNYRACRLAHADHAPRIDAHSLLRNCDVEQLVFGAVGIGYMGHARTADRQRGAITKATVCCIVAATFIYNRRRPCVDTAENRIFQILVLIVVVGNPRTATASERQR